MPENSQRSIRELTKVKSLAYILAVVTTTAFVGYYFAFAANTTIGNNISTSGTLTVGSYSLFSGNIAASSTLQVTGTTTLYNAIVNSGTATSTFANGIQLSGGCFRDASGSCISGGSSLFTDGGETSYLTSLTDNFGIGTTSTAFKLGVHGNAIFSGNISSVANITATGTLNVAGLSTFGNASSTQISSSNSAYFATTGGSVGIGTTSPSQLLSVHGNALFSGNLTLANLTATGTLTISGTSGTSTIANSLSVADGAFYVEQSSNYIGIGTTTPSGAQLVITNETTGSDAVFTKFGYFGSSAQSGLRFKDETDGNEYAAIKWNPTNAIDRFDFYVGSSGNASDIKMSLGSTGLGVGTTTPGSLFAVHGNGLFSGNLSLANLTATGTLTVSGLASLNANASTTQLTTTGSTYLATLGGSVGIGTTTPGTQLALHSGSSFINFGVTSTSTFSQGINLLGGCIAVNGTCVGAGGSGTINSGTTNRLSYYSGATTLDSANFLSIDASNQRFGVGTTSPFKRLSVEGGVYLHTASGTPATLSGVDFGVLTVSAVSNSGKYAYIGTSNTSDTNPEIKIYDVSTSSPAFVGGVDVGSAVYRLHSSGNYLYVAKSNSGNTTKDFVIYDVSDPASPSEIGGIDLGLELTAMFISGKYAYLGTTPAGLAGKLITVDISDPANLKILGYFEFGRNVSDIYVSGKYAYVVTNYHNSASEFRVINISDPSNLTEVGSGANHDINTNSIYVSGSYAYVISSNTAGNDFHIYDISDPAALVEVGGVDLGANGVLVRVAGKYAYVAKANGGNTSNDFIIYDVSNPSSPIEVGGVDFSIQVQSLNISGKYAYVGLASASGNDFVILDIAGVDLPSASIGSISGNTLNISEDAILSANVLIGGGLSVGSKGILSSGSLAISATTSYSSILGGLFVGTTTPATTSPNYSQFSSSVMVVEATSSSAIPLTIRGAGTQTGNYFQIQSSDNTNKFVLSSSGRLGIGTTTPGTLLSLHSGSDYINFGVTSTSTFSKGVNLLSGCIAVNGTCIGGGSGTVGAATSIGQISYYAEASSVLTATSSILINTDRSVTFAGNILPSASPTFGSYTAASTSIDSSVAGANSLSIGSDGFPIISYYDSDATLKFVKCADAKCSSTTINSIDATAGAGAQSSIVIGTDGFPIIAYYLGGASLDLKVAKCTTATCSSTTITSLDATGNVGGSVSITIGSDGLPIISYDDATNGDLKVAKCSNASCTSATLNSLDTANDVGGSGTSIKIGTDGLPIISYRDDVNLSLKVAKCGDLACSTSIITTLDDTGDNVGLYSALAIRPNGLPFIAYGNATGNDLIVVDCLNTSCTSAATTTVDSTNSVATGGRTSVAIGTDGLPIISYTDSTSTGMKVAKCNNSSCSSSTITELDSDGNMTYTSIAIAPDGLPVISYDATLNNLKVAKCSNSSCVAYSGAVGSGGSSLGSLSSFFGNVYANTYWGKKFQITSFDLAESYPSSDLTIEPGDIVALEGMDAKLIKKSYIGDLTVGVVSTEPAINFVDFSDSYKRELENKNLRDFPVALAGRIPVKVNLEGGDIAIGDPITISSEAGIGKKAIESGRIVGYALENYSGPTNENGGKVLVFASLEYWNSSSESDVNGQMSNVDSLFAQVVDIVKDWLESMQVFVENGIVRLKSLVADKVVTDGIEMRDKATGDVYCVVIENGEFTKTPGECTSASLNDSQSESLGEQPAQQDVLAPIITLSGSSSITITKGDTWVDPGASVSDPADDTHPENNNLSIYYKVNGTDTGNEGRDLPQSVIDTNTAGTYTITYTATDSAGNMGTAERTLTVEDPTPAPTLEPEPIPEPTPEEVPAA